MKQHDNAPVTASKAPAEQAIARRRRVPREARHRAILDEATQLFAEKGLSADMRELARRVGITHPALFRHFSNKDALIAEVYDRAFLGGWDPVWEETITDRSRPLIDRLTAFYQSFAKVALSAVWVRLYMFAAMEGLDIHKRLYRFIETQLIQPLCIEIRHSYGLPDIEQSPLREIEVELVWSFHSRIFYLGIRKHIYGMTLPDDLDAVIAAEAATMTGGLGPYLAELLKAA